MSGSALTRERTITVETGGLGAVRVRRLSLGGIARIAQRLREEGVHDEVALADALVCEVVIAGIGAAAGAADGEPGDVAAPVDAQRLALLSDEDRRSIAAAVLTLEGVKAAGEDVREDPRTILARRFARVLDMRGAATPGDVDVDADAHAGDARAAQPAGSTQLPLFEGLLSPPQPTAASPDPTRTAPPPRAWERERERLQADVADLEALLAQQAEQREALEAREAAAGERAQAAERAARRYRWLAGGTLAVLVVVLGAQFAWIGMLSNDLAEQRAQFDERLRAQQQALDQAKRAAAEATARADRLAAQRLARPAPATARPQASSSRPPASPARRSASKTPVTPQRRP